MDLTLALGRFLFTAALVTSGMEQIFRVALRLPARYILPVAPANAVFALALGAGLILAGFSIAANQKARSAALALGGVFFLIALFVWSPAALAHFASGSIRTPVFETLSFCAGALMLAGLLRPRKFKRYRSKTERALITSGPYLFAICAIVFGLDHMLYLSYVATLIPSWIPGSGLFWAWFTAVAFIAAGGSIAIRRMDFVSSFLLGMMFLLWLVILHIPRVLYGTMIHDPNLPNEWSSTFVAMGMSGISFITACQSRQRHQLHAARTFNHPLRTANITPIDQANRVA